jgi:hypothetical protein
MRAVLLACLISVLPRAVDADEVPPPSEPATEEPPPKKEEPAPDPDSRKYDGPVIKGALRPREIVVDVPGVRSSRTKLILGSLLAAGAVGGGIGLAFHLQSRSASNEVSAQLFTGKVWTDEREQRVDDAAKARGRAIIGYTIGGAFITATIAMFIATDPKSERQVIRPHHAGVTPLPGGGMASAGWSF